MQKLDPTAQAIDWSARSIMRTFPEYQGTILGRTELLEAIAPMLEQIQNLPATKDSAVQYRQLVSDLVGLAAAANLASRNGRKVPGEPQNLETL